jgi:hypothetical protein
MNNKIFFIGDSHTAFFSGSTKNVYNVKEYQVGNHEFVTDETEVYFGWQHSRAAYSVDSDLLKQLIDPFYDSIDEDSFIVFCFGAMDTQFHLKKYNNCQEVVKKYVDNCIKFAEGVNAKIIFMETWYNNNAIEQYTEFNNYLYSYSIEKGIHPPIKIINNIVEYNYKSEDFYNHMGKKDSKKVLEYSIEIVKGLF